MTHVIIMDHGYLYAYRTPTEQDDLRFFRNGYSTPELVREERPEVYRYLRGQDPPRYPVPALIYHVYYPGERGWNAGNEYGSIWEYSRFHIEPYETTYNKRVAVLPPP